MWPRNYCLGAVIGPFFITAGGNFEVDMITDEDNPKKELKIFKCAGKNACPHIFMVTISGIQRKRDYVTRTSTAWASFVFGRASQFTYMVSRELI